MIRSRRSVLTGAALALAVLAAACGPGPTPTAPPSPGASQAPPGLPILACVGFGEAECRFVAERVTSTLPPDRGAPFAIQLTLVECLDGNACPWSLSARNGRAIVEYRDGSEPLAYWLEGPPVAPGIEVMTATWSGITGPSSPRVVGSGPFEFSVGHCGLSHVVDFDGSFWVLLGAVDPEATAWISSDRGSIRLLGPDVAEYRGSGGLVVRLARFPGPKRFFLCD